MAAAQAGYKVAAFDIFNDAETRRFSFVSEQVDFRDGGFEAEDLWNRLTSLLPEGTAVTYGSGLEAQIAVLERIDRHFTLIGNSPAALALVKQPSRFFPLLTDLNIPHPETRLDKQIGADWLAKKGGGSGGTHIRRCDDNSGGDYYQRYIEGRPVSVLFLADGQQVEVVGYNEQWLAPTPAMPFRYGGIVGNAELPESVRIAMATAALKVTRAADLRGLNSMDFILPADGVPLALEVNPRLSASFGLYGNSPNLFEQHIQSCLRELQRPLAPMQGARAALVHYATYDFEVGDVNWPSWITDRPVAGTCCRAGEPVCTILGEAADAPSAKALVFARASELVHNYKV